MVFEYDISISPASGTAQRRFKRRLFQLAEQTQDWAAKGLKDNVAHDFSAKAIAAKKLPDPLDIKILYYDDDEAGPKPDAKEYIISFKFIQNLDTGNLTKWVIVP